MQNVLKIIQLMGGIEKLEEEHISLTVPGFMPLSIEYVGEGPRGGVLISVMHHYVQNGDLMRDPDLVVELEPETQTVLPYSFQQDSIGLYQEVLDTDEHGKIISTDEALQASLLGFMALWDRNLADQGFVKAAEVLAADRARIG